MHCRAALCIILVAASSTLAATAPTPAAAPLVTPILNPGQTWVMHADAARSGWPASGVLLPLGTYRKVGAASVKFTFPVRNEGPLTVSDDLFYDPLDSDPEFIVGTRLVTRPGLAPVSVSCLVRTPHTRIGAAQQGLLIVGALTSREAVAGVMGYLNGGLQAAQPTCTLTRIR